MLLFLCALFLEGLQRGRLSSSAQGEEHEKDEKGKTKTKKAKDGHGAVEGGDDEDMISLELKEKWSFPSFPSFSKKAGDDHAEKTKTDEKLKDEKLKDDSSSILSFSLFSKKPDDDHAEKDDHGADDDAEEKEEKEEDEISLELRDEEFSFPFF
jgi:hypothetical protein